VPAAQATFAAVSPAHQVPASQAVQTAGELALPDAVISVPAAHLSWATQADRFALAA
jgi:hypothetical protein